MLKNKKVLLIIFLLLIIAFFSKGLLVAAVVNGKPISRLAIIDNLEKRGGKQVLDSAVSKELILQEAANKKIVVEKEAIDKKVKAIEANIKKQGQTLAQVLTLQGMTSEELNDQLHIQLILEKLLADKVKVSDKEIDAYLKKINSDEANPVQKSPGRNEVRDQLRQEKLQSQATALVEQLKKKAKISYFVNY